MGKSVNKVLLLGHIGKAPEVRTTGGGTTVASFSLATTERRKDNRGEWQDHTEWHGLVAFGRTAEILRDYTGKGSKVFIEGRLQTRSWEKDGHKFYRTEIVIDDLTLLDGKGQREDRSADHPTGGRTPHRDESAPVRGASYDYMATDEDVPF